MRPAFPNLPRALAWLRPALYVVVLTAAGLAAHYPPAILADAEARLSDHLQRLAASAVPEARIAIVDIDEASLAEFGPWPWPRARLADLIEALLADGRARAVALDMVLPEPADAVGDRRLALLAAHAPLAFATAFDFLPRQPPLAVGRLAGGRATDRAGHPVPATGYIANHAGLADARCVGNIGFLPDADGVLRRLPAAVRFQERDYPPLAAVLLDCAAPPVPSSAAGRWRLPWRQRDAYTVVSAADVLAGRIPGERLAGRYVFVGATALGLADRVATPLEAAVPGVLVHAVGASALLDAAAAPPPWSARGQILALAYSLALALLAYRLLPRLPAWGAAALPVGGALAWLPLALPDVAAGAAFPLAAPLYVASGLLLLAVPLEWRLAQHAHRRVVELFAHYVSPAVLDELLALPAAALAPAQREITVLVADMEGYTRHVTRLPLAAAAGLTREFLDILTRPVLDTGGTLDKYTGDGLVAFWGAPLPSSDAPQRALAAAAAMQAGIARFNRRRAAAGLPVVRVRIGIESGHALVGDLGTPFRSAYTAVGDCINFAAKLQEAAREQAVDLLIGPGAAARLPAAGLVPVAHIILRGGDVPIVVHTAAPGPTSEIPSIS